MSELISNRKAAKLAGNKYYFTGLRCTRGAVAKRLTSTGYCQCDGCQEAKRAGNRKAKQAAYLRDPERCRRESREYYDANIDEVRLKLAKYRKSIREWQRQYNLEYRKANKEKIAECHRDWRERNPHQVAIRRLLYRVIQATGGDKKATTVEVLGYSPMELKRHLERQFAKGMSWANYGDWHIDHIVSIADMLKSGESRPEVINCLTNLQPRWALENLAKGSKRETLL